MPKIKRKDVVPYVDKVFGYTIFVLLPLGAHIKKFQPQKNQLRKYEEVRLRPAIMRDCHCAFYKSESQ